MRRELQPGDPQQIGPYRIRGLLGVGGMGRVFLGASAAGQLVAVKVSGRTWPRMPSSGPASGGKSSWRKR